jgi:hypothetical protein
VDYIRCLNISRKFPDGIGIGSLIANGITGVNHFLVETYQLPVRYTGTNHGRVDVTVDVLFRRAANSFPDTIERRWCAAWARR